MNESGLLSSNIIIHNCHRFYAPYDVFYDAGFRPGRRGPFDSAKGPKTIDAQPGHLRWVGRERVEGEPTRYAQTRPADYQERPTRHRAAGVGKEGKIAWISTDHFPRQHKWFL